MKATIFKSLALGAIIAFTALMSSCSKEASTIQSTIPASSPIIVGIDVEKVIESLDCKLEDGQLIVSERFQKYFTDAKSRMAITMIGSFLDKIEEESVYVVTDTRTGYLTLLAENTDDLCEFIEKNMHAVSAGSSGEFSKVYTVGSSRTILVRDNQFWFMEKPQDKAVAYISEQLKAAKKQNVNDVKTLADKLGADDMVRIAVSNSLANPGAQAGWACINGDVVDNAIVANVTTINANGDPVSAPEGLTNIDTGFLAHMPTDFNFITAAGLSSDIDWNKLLAPAQMMADRKTAGMIDLVIPFLKSINGTVALGCRIPTEADMTLLNNGDLSTLRVALMVHMEQSKLNETVGQIEMLLSGMGATSVAEGNGLYAVTIPEVGATLRYGSLDGYLVISTVSLDGTYGSSRVNVFEGKKSAMLLNLPNLATNYHAGAFDFGLDIKAESNGVGGKIIIKLDGNDGPIIPEIIEAAINTEKGR